MFNEDFQLHPDEKVILYVRRHWFFLLLDILKIIFYFLGFAVLVWVFQYFNFVPNFVLFGVSLSSLADVLLYMWGIFCWLLLAEKVTDYAIDFWIVTNKRIVDSELQKLFHRSLATLELRDIEDISIETTGFVSSYLAYGSLKVQTAGARNEFDMQRIGHPEIVQRIIFEAKLAQDREEKDIEKEEVEQISHRVFKEEVKNDFHIPTDQKISKEQEDYDWARIAEKQKNDIRNIEEEVESIDEKYKRQINEALRTE